MKIIAIGWGRNVVGSREIASFPLSDAAESDGYKYSNLTKSVSKNIEEMRYYKSGFCSEIPPYIRYGFRVNIDRTMGGDYAFDIQFSEDDVLDMFLSLMGEKSILEISERLSKHKVAKGAPA